MLDGRIIHEDLIFGRPSIRVLQEFISFYKGLKPHQKALIINLINGRTRDTVDNPLEEHYTLCANSSFQPLDANSFNLSSPRLSESSAHLWQELKETSSLVGAHLARMELLMNGLDEEFTLHINSSQPRIFTNREILQRLFKSISGELLMMKLRLPQRVPCKRLHFTYHPALNEMKPQNSGPEATSSTTTRAEKVQPWLRTTSQELLNSSIKSFKAWF